MKLNKKQFNELKYLSNIKSEKFTNLKLIKTKKYEHCKVQYRDESWNINGKVFVVRFLTSDNKKDNPLDLIQSQAKQELFIMLDDYVHDRTNINSKEYDEYTELLYKLDKDLS